MTADSLITSALNAEIAARVNAEEPLYPTWYTNAIALGIPIPDFSMKGIEAYLLTNFPEVFI